MLSENIQEYEDVQITAFLSTLTKSANILNDVRVLSPSLRKSHLASPNPFEFAAGG
jgi:hypothetical protein